MSGLASPRVHETARPQDHETAWGLENGEELSESPLRQIHEDLVSRSNCSYRCSQLRESDLRKRVHVQLFAYINAPFAYITGPFLTI